MNNRLRLASYARQTAYALIAATLILLAIECLLERLAQ
jgi:hypothetical protein